MNFPDHVTFREASDMYEKMWGQSPEEKAWTLQLQREMQERYHSPAMKMRRKLRRLSYAALCSAWDALQNQSLDGEYDDGIPMTEWAEQVQAEKSAREARYRTGWLSRKKKPEAERKGRKKMQFIVKRELETRGAVDPGEPELIDGTLLVGEETVLMWTENHGPYGHDYCTLRPAFHKGNRMWLKRAIWQSAAGYSANGTQEDIMGYEEGVNLLITHGVYGLSKLENESSSLDYLPPRVEAEICFEFFHELETFINKMGDQAYILTDVLPEDRADGNFDTINCEVEGRKLALSYRHK